MAASMQLIGNLLCRITPSILQPLRPFQSLQRIPGQPCLRTSPFMLPSHSFCNEASAEKAAKPKVVTSRYKDRPWDYLESEEYIEKYGTSSVWTGYRRNHKGGIPPQKTRKTCIRGVKNVKLLKQFINSETGIVYDPTRTGICMKQQKLLVKAVGTAKDHGFLTFQIPYVHFSEQDFSSSHDAVGKTPPPPSLSAGDSWYKWYGEIIPDETEVAKVKKIYADYLK
ncbi:small ribosomal subunit protein mS40 isoform X2 [Cynoglossus semilaevis]|uniref:small ribosomal subunit protein mS40 isoform X2 n=1 Tax=Cynoglossus semilaevis TaxID=244447 RepID=UPI0007DC94E5|nr:28S ribosomal protein S18b, mitochondrial isoform X2 [Cynoglossus semilaevis]